MSDVRVGRRVGVSHWRKAKDRPTIQRFLVRRTQRPSLDHDFGQSRAFLVESPEHGAPDVGPDVVPSTFATASSGSLLRESPLAAPSTALQSSSIMDRLPDLENTIILCETRFYQRGSPARTDGRPLLAPGSVPAKPPAPVCGYGEQSILP